MATIELDLQVTADLDEEGITLTLYVGDEDDGKSTSITFDTLVDQLMEDVDLNEKSDCKYAENIAKALAEASKHIYCNLT